MTKSSDRNEGTVPAGFEPIGRASQTTGTKVHFAFLFPFDSSSNSLYINALQSCALAVCLNLWNCNL